MLTENERDAIHTYARKAMDAKRDHGVESQEFAVAFSHLSMVVNAIAEGLTCDPEERESSIGGGPP